MLYNLSLPNIVQTKYDAHRFLCFHFLALVLSYKLNPPIGILAPPFPRGKGPCCMFGSSLCFLRLGCPFLVSASVFFPFGGSSTGSLSRKVVPLRLLRGLGMLEEDPELFMPLRRMREAGGDPIFGFRFSDPGPGEVLKTGRGEAVAFQSVPSHSRTSQKGCWKTHVLYQRPFGGFHVSGHEGNSQTIL